MLKLHFCVTCWPEVELLAPQRYLVKCAVTGTLIDRESLPGIIGSLMDHPTATDVAVSLSGSRAVLSGAVVADSDAEAIAKMGEPFGAALNMARLSPTDGEWATYRLKRGG